jgi:hypothetical protein
MACTWIGVCVFPAAPVLEHAELPAGLLAGQQAFHDNACKNELVAADIIHSFPFPRVSQVKGGAKKFAAACKKFLPPSVPVIEALRAAIGGRDHAKDR